MGSLVVSICTNPTKKMKLKLTACFCIALLATAQGSPAYSPVVSRVLSVDALLGCPVDKPIQCIEDGRCCPVNYRCCAMAVAGQVFPICLEVGGPCPPEYCICE